MIRTSLIVLVIALAWFVRPQSAPMAETLFQCPDLAGAQQVGTCPDQRELDRMFRATCGGAQNPNAKDPLLCDSLEGFKKVKAVSLWEVVTPRMEMMDYLPCDFTAGSKRQARTLSLRCSRRVCTLDCDYGDGIVFSHRVKGACQIATGATDDGTVAACGPDGTACAARCP